MDDVARNVAVVFVLNGGPRAGQLVDDLPLGYHLLPEHLEAPTPFVVGDTTVAVAVWDPDDLATP